MSGFELLRNMLPFRSPGKEGGFWIRLATCPDFFFKWNTPRQVKPNCYRTVCVKTQPKFKMSRNAMSKRYASKQYEYSDVRPAKIKKKTYTSDRRGWTTVRNAYMT